MSSDKAPGERKIITASRIRPLNDTEVKLGAVVSLALEREGETKTKTKAGIAVRIATPSGSSVHESGITFWSASGFRRSTDGLLEPDLVNRSSTHEYATNEAIYQDLFHTNVMDALDNGLSCAFISFGPAYSGKTFTVIGKKPNRGLLPLTLNTIVRRLEQCKREADFSRKHRVYLSMYQICNDKIYDMQSTETTGDSTGREPTEVKESALFFESLVFTRILTESDGHAALETAGGNASKLRGDNMPFSHSIYTITIDSTHETTSPPQLSTAHIHFVITGDTDRAQPAPGTAETNESKILARSLNALRGVLSSLKTPSDVPPPFADSCLTRSLNSYFQDRRWRTVVCAALSPASTAVLNTVDTLRFLSLTPEAPPQPPAAAPVAAKRGRASGPSEPDLLLVEDIAISKRIAQLQMQKASYKVEVASDGESAVEAFKTHWRTLKIVLMDIGLPKMSGTEASRIIREFERTKRETPCVIILGLTATMEEDNLEDYKKAGMNGCIMKGNLVAEAVSAALKELVNEPRKFVTLTLASKVKGPGETSPRRDGPKEKKSRGGRGSPRQSPRQITRALRARVQAPEVTSGEVDNADSTPVSARGAKNEAPPAKQSSRATTASVAPAPGVPKQPTAAAAIFARHQRGGGSVRAGIGLPSAREPVRIGQKQEIKALSPTAAAAAAAPPLALDVLLVEDIKVSQKAAQRALQQQGYRVEVANDGEEAVSKFRNASFAVVLMDIGLPGIQGTEAASQIRAIERERGSGPVVMFGLTGNGEEGNLEQYKEVGMNGCILKGVPIAEAVRVALRQRAANPARFVQLLSKKELDEAVTADGGAPAAAGGGGAAASPEKKPPVNVRASPKLGARRALQS